MKIQLFIAMDDKDYLDYLSQVLADRYADTFEVSTCSLAERLEELGPERGFDVALLSPHMAEQAPPQMAKLTLILWDGTEQEYLPGHPLTRKYQRISRIVSDILQQYAEISNSRMGLQTDQARIVAAWSPSGGCGKTTAALAYAAQMVSEGRKTVYLNLEPFSSTPLYFTQNGKSLSSVFEKLDGNVELLLQSIRQEDEASGILYFCRPDNYDDIQALTCEDVVRLVTAAAQGVEEVVLDLGSGYDLKIRALLELADHVLLVSDGTRTSQEKLEQFRVQNDLFEQIRGKTVFVANRGHRGQMTQVGQTVVLPQVQSEDPVVIYKTLSGGYFNR